MLITINLFHIYKSSDSEKYSRWSIYMAAEEVTAAMDKDINDHNEDGGHQDWPYKEIVAIAGKHKSINILLQFAFILSILQPYITLRDFYLFW